MDSIESDTELLPHVIADSVVQEAARFLDDSVPLGYTERLAERAETCYTRGGNFRKSLRARGNAGRDTLYAFMRHWLAAHLQSDHPAMFARLPKEFANGVEITCGRVG